MGYEEKILAEAKRLSGHAIQVEYQYAHDGELVGMRLHHYLTCRKCQQQRLISELVTLGAWQSAKDC